MKTLAPLYEFLGSILYTCGLRVQCSQIRRTLLSVSFLRVNSTLPPTSFSSKLCHMFLSKLIPGKENGTTMIDLDYTSLALWLGISPAFLGHGQNRSWVPKQNQDSVRKKEREYDCCVDNYDSPFSK